MRGWTSGDHVSVWPVEAVLCRWQNLFMREGMDGLLRDKTRPGNPPRCWAEAMDAETPGKKRRPLYSKCEPQLRVASGSNLTLGALV